MKKYFLLINFIFLFVTFCVSNSYACSCMPLKAITAEDVQNNEAIFEGTVKKIVVDEKEGIKRITFKVKKWYKGKPTKGCKKRKVVVETASSGAACGLSVGKGEVWFLWARQYGKSGKLSTSLCNRNAFLPKSGSTKLGPKPNMDRYKADVAFLNEIAL